MNDQSYLGVSEIGGEIPVNVFLNPEVLTQKVKRAPAGVMCKNCGVSFSDRKLKEQHEIEMHSSNMVAFCGQCNKGFFSQSGYRFHMRVHESKSGNSQSSECPTCGKFFQSSSHLRRHMRSHTGEKPFFCPTCRKGYKHKKDLQYHFENGTCIR